MALLETSSFKLTFPESWKIESLSPRALVSGPEGQSVEISTFKIDGDGDISKIRDALRTNLFVTFSEFPKGSGAEPRTERQSFESPGSEEFYQQLFQSADRASALGLFGILNGRNAVLASVELPVGKAAIMGEVASYFDKIVWDAESINTNKKPFWKIW